MIFENLFAVYYRFAVAQRNFVRKIGLRLFATRTENFDAALMLAVVQVLFISVAVGWTIKELKLHLPVWLIFLGLPLFYYCVYINNKAFAKNREKRRIILDNYNNLSQTKKGGWIMLSILVLVIPVYLISVLINNK